MAKKVYIGVDGLARQVKKLYVGVDGVARKVKKGYIGVGGVARLFYQSGIPLSELPHGALVNINESGTAVPFYLSKHDYESGLNGEGRTLLVRKDVYGVQVWNSSNVNTYASSTIDTWFNGTFKALFPSDIQEAMATTKFYYTPGNGNNTVSTLERSVFALSVTELGRSVSYANSEGSALPIASTLKIAYMDGSSHDQWTRSPRTDNKNKACFLTGPGGDSYEGCSISHGARPCFTLPSTMLVNPEPNADGSYNLILE